MSAQAVPLNGELTKFLIRNGAGDSVETIARVKHLELFDLNKCRLAVADEMYAMVSDSSGLALSLVTDPAGAVSTMVATGSEIFSTAIDVFDHIEGTLGPAVLRCTEAAARAQNIAGCQPYVDQLRRGVTTAFMKMGSVTAAIYRSIVRRCEIKGAGDSPLR